MANLVIKPTFLSIIAEEKSSKSAPEVHVSTLKEGDTLEELIKGECSDEKPDRSTSISSLGCQKRSTTNDYGTEGFSVLLPQTFFEGTRS